MTISRRSLLTLAVTSGLIESTAWAKKKDALPPLALDVAVAEVGGKPVVSDDWLLRQIAESRRLMRPHRVALKLVRRRPLTERSARLETAEDRDAMARHLQPRAINAFIVESIRDIDDTERFIRGVRWRLRRNLNKDYLLVSAIAGPFTLCHELGHLLGNGHSNVVNNVMSYRHEAYEKIQFDDRQGAKMRRVARRLLRSKKVLSADDWTRANENAD